MAVERFADKTGDRFLCSQPDLEWLANTRGGANAERKLRRLAAKSPLTLRREGAGWELHLPNFAEKQGFKIRKRSETVHTAAAAASPTATATPKEEDGGDWAKDVQAAMNVLKRSPGTAD